MINTIQMINSWFSQALRGFAGYTNAVDHEYFFDAAVDFEATFGVNADLRGYFLELADGRRLRLHQVVSSVQVELFDPALELSLVGQRWWIRKLDTPSDHLWAEVTYLDNRPTIESNFGKLINFTLDDLAARTDNLDYLTAVQGLWYYVWHSRTPFRTRVGSQIILGLPFAEARGNIIDLQLPFDATRNRILVQDSDNPSMVRAYLFPSTLAVEINPETGVPYSMGETVEQFAPLCEGVVVTDYIEDPEWFATYLGSGDFYEPQKLHTWGVIIDAAIFDLNNLLFLISYLRVYKPRYSDPLFAIVKLLQQSVDVGDPMLLGPVVPRTGYTYPVEWPAYGIPTAWSTSPHEVTRAVVPNVPENLGIEFGGLRLADAPGKIPDGWAGPWPSGAAGAHVPTISEGSFRFDDTDESGHYIHRFDEHLFAVNLLDDGDLELPDNPGAGVSPWDLVGAPATAVKVAGPPPVILSGTRSLHIADVMGGVGVEQVLDGVGNHPGPFVLDEGFQVGASVWVYLVSGQANLIILDQNNPQTVLAEWRHVTHPGQWYRINLHAWEVSAHDTNYVTFQALTGPAGGDFYLDAAGAADWQEVGVFEKAMPWEQHGFDRAISGRTGGFTPGGLPDEELAFQIAIPVP